MRLAVIAGTNAISKFQCLSVRDGYVVKQTKGLGPGVRRPNGLTDLDEKTFTNRLHKNNRVRHGVFVDPRIAGPAAGPALGGASVGFIHTKARRIYVISKTTGARLGLKVPRFGDITFARLDHGDEGVGHSNIKAVVVHGESEVIGSIHVGPAQGI
jgi:hypothetical protein